MRIVLRTPAELIHEVDVPDVDAQSTDDEILAAVAAGSAVEVRPEEVEAIGDPYIYMRGPDSLAEAGRRRKLAIQHQEALTDQVKQLAFDAIDAGLSKNAVAAQAAVTRVTLDAWLKPREGR